MFAIVNIAPPCDPPVGGDAADESDPEAPELLPPAPVETESALDAPSLGEPYKHWNRHSGEAAECVALVHTTNGQTVSGLVIRCDGFVLVPRTVYADLDAKANIGVSVTGAENETLTVPFPVAGRLHVPGASVTAW